MLSQIFLSITLADETSTSCYLEYTRKNMNTSNKMSNVIDDS